jgi:cytochrome c-type biogenesis protein CcmH/NrfF
MKTLLLVFMLTLSQATFSIELYSERAMALFRQIQCPTCHSQTVDASESLDAGTIREKVVDMIDAGETDEAIKKAVVEEYGVHIVKDYSKPIMKTWAYSIIILILIVYFISRSRRRKKDT